jgi:hypothetical protein
VLLAFITWRTTRNELLLVASAAAIAHFTLYPSPEMRYLLWYCVLVGILFIQTQGAAARANITGHHGIDVAMQAAAT